MKSYNKKILAITLMLIASFIVDNHAIAVVNFNLPDQKVHFYDPNACRTSSKSVALSGKDNTEKILSFFMEKGLTLAAAAGFVGNMQEESTLRTDIEQGGRIVDEDYEMKPGVGFGLIQWTTGERQKRLIEKAKTSSKSITDIEVQLETAWDELNSDDFKYVLDELEGIDDPREAALIIHGSPHKYPGKRGFEASKHYGDDEYIREGIRGDTAEKVFYKYNDEPPIATLAEAANGETTSSNMEKNKNSTPRSSKSEKATIAIDPGHNPVPINEYDDKTGAFMKDYGNGAEDADAFDVSSRVKEMLEEKGYGVVMLKESVSESVSYRERVDRAEEANAAMAVSVHTSPGINQVFPQRVGNWRSPTDENDPKAVKFTNEETASLSLEYSDAMAKARSEIEGTNVIVKDNIFNGRAPLWQGNIPMIALLSENVPWVYNEMGPLGGGGGANPISESDKQKYAEGIVAGIEAADPESRGSGRSDACGGGGSGAGSGFDATLLDYAWPDPIPNGDTTPTPGYQEKVIDRFAEEGADFGYIGGTTHPGIDCGGFVTRLTVDSGYEREYNSDGKGGPTEFQEKWNKENREKIADGPVDPAELKKGDVAMQEGHTFIFVGEVDGFNSNVASASLNSRAPAAGGNSVTEPGTRWYRKK